MNKPTGFEFSMAVLMIAGPSCSSQPVNKVDPKEAIRFNRKLVREAVVFEPGTEKGAVVPEISAPHLRAVWVPERVEGSRLIEAHREWLMEGDVSILGIPTVAPKAGEIKK